MILVGPYMLLLLPLIPCANRRFSAQLGGSLIPPTVILTTYTALMGTRRVALVGRFFVEGATVLRENRIKRAFALGPPLPSGAVLGSLPVVIEDPQHFLQFSQYETQAGPSRLILLVRNARSPREMIRAEQALMM